MEKSSPSPTTEQARAMAEAVMLPAQAQQQARTDARAKRDAASAAWRARVHGYARWVVPGLVLGGGVALWLGQPLWAGALAGSSVGGLLALLRQRNTASRPR